MIVYPNIVAKRREGYIETKIVSRIEAASAHHSQDKEMVWYFVMWVTFMFCLCFVYV